MSNPPEIYWIAGSPYAWRILLALEIKQVSYESHLLEASKKQQKSTEYLAINPEGTVPALRLGAYVVTQSLAILAFLERKYPTPRLFGDTAEETGTIWKQVLGFDETLACVISDDFNRPLFRGRVPEMADSVREAAARLRVAFRTFDVTLSGSHWLSGASISALDVCFYPFLEAALRAATRDCAGTLDLGLAPLGENFPALEAWRARMAALPGADLAWPPHWK